MESLQRLWRVVKVSIKQIFIAVWLISRLNKLLKWLLSPLEKADIDQDELYERAEDRLFTILHDQVDYYKGELSYYRDQVARLQDLLIERGSFVEKVEIDPDYTEPNLVPIRGSLSPSAKKAELERLHRQRARDHKENKVFDGI